ncbi:MAG: thermonuclease family protein [Deltaproteobacteria bacterium]|nr:thermonuclease family protein [Deltaproteobacteria bacterium]
MPKRAGGHSAFSTLLLAWCVAFSAVDASARERKPPRASEAAVVKRAVDGDTLELEDGRKVRLLGVDAPELRHPKAQVETFGAAARDFTQKQVAGQTVRLEFESRTTDKYGRVLAYVYVASTGFFLNSELVAQGYAHVESRWPFRHLDEFRELERNARTKALGLWGPVSNDQP